MHGKLLPPDVEREYDNRSLVPEHPAFFARWERDSRFVRETLGGTIDLPYGPDARHRVDLFRAARPRGTLVFIHGGYWRALDKSFFSWLASPWVAAGMNVALPNYRLCPAVAIADIVEDVLAAVNWLFEGAERNAFAMERVVVSGHSAGGHLTAALLASRREQLRFDTGRIAGAASLSGLVDFAPLVHFSYNADLRLTPESAAALDLYERKPTLPVPMVVAVGGDESSEFKRQSRLLAESWPNVKTHLVLPGVNHFSIVDAFAERGQPLFESTLSLFK